MREGRTAPKNENQTLYLFPPLPDDDSLGTLSSGTSLGSARLQRGAGRLSPWEGARGGMWWCSGTSRNGQKKHLRPLAG